MDETIQLDAPTELRTFLVADIRGYTRFTEERGDEAAGRLAARFAQLSRESAEQYAGRVWELRGDEALAVFGSARQALRAALDLKERCDAATETDPTLPLPIGIGLDAGEAVAVEGGFRGAALNLAARLCGIAGPGEVLAGEGLVYLARKTEGLVFVERRSVELKGFSEPVRVFQVLPEGAEVLPATVPPAQVAAPRPLRPPIPYREQLAAQLGDDFGIGESMRGLGDAIRQQVRQELAGARREVSTSIADSGREIRAGRGREMRAGHRQVLRQPRTVREVVIDVVTAIVLLIVIALIVRFVFL